MNPIKNNFFIVFICKVYESLTCVEISPKASNGIRWLRWIVTYPVNKDMKVLNNWGLVNR